MHRSARLAVRHFEYAKQEFRGPFSRLLASCCGTKRQRLGARLATGTFRLGTTLSDEPTALRIWEQRYVARCAPAGAKRLAPRKPFFCAVDAFANNDGGGHFPLIRYTPIDASSSGRR